MKILLSLIITLFIFACEENTTDSDKKVKPKKTEITIGAGGTTKSANFKMKVSVGKLKSTKELSSTNYKMKVANSTK